MSTILYVCNGFNPVEESETITTLQNAYPEFAIQTCGINDIKFDQEDLKGIFIEASAIESYHNLLSNMSDFSGNYPVNIRFLCSPYGMNYSDSGNNISIENLFELSSLREILSLPRVKMLNSFSRFPTVGGLLGPSGIFKLNCLSNKKLLNPDANKVSETVIPSNTFYFNLMTSTNKQYHLNVIESVAQHWMNREGDRDFEDERNCITINVLVSSVDDIKYQLYGVQDKYPVTINSKVKIIVTELSGELYDNGSSTSINHIYSDTPGYLLYLNAGSVFHEDILVAQSYGNILISLKNNYLPYSNPNNSISVDYNNDINEFAINICKTISKAISNGYDLINIAKNGKSYASINPNVPALTTEILEDFILSLLDSIRGYELDTGSSDVEEVASDVSVF